MRSDRSEPALRVHFKDDEVGARLGAAVARALRALPQLRRVDNGSSGELLAWEDASDAEPAPPGLQNDDDMPLFVEDTAPSTVQDLIVPSYNRKFDLLTTDPVKEENKPKKFGVECFNCGDFHTLKDCPHPKDYEKINSKRNENRTKNIRYHADEGLDEEGNPGQISKKLRKALGLRKHQLPLHIYRMRLLGYPPGWLMHARIAHSGIAMFDSQGKPVVENEDKICQFGSKDEYDIEKILEFPGFNIPPSSKYTDESDTLGFPPYNEEHSKMVMLENLAPRAAQAYKRKKMKEANKPEFQPGDLTIEMDMDLDEENEPQLNGNGVSSLIPPLPIEPLPPVETSLPPPMCAPPLSPFDISLSSIPVPSTPNKTAQDESSSRSESPSLTDLESQKLYIMAALEEKESTVENTELTKKSPSPEQSSPPPYENGNHNISPDLDDTASDVGNDSFCKSASLSSLTSTPRQGHVRQSVLGTPTFNLSQYSDLPQSASFSKDICDEILFDNLPESTGKYEQMSELIKKIRSEVTKIHQD